MSIGRVSVGDEVPARRRVFTPADVAAYAHASGDMNPLHRDDAVARAAGFDGIIAHGMFTMGHLASTVADWWGDAGAIAELTAQFRAPVLMGETITAAGRVASVDADAGTVTLELWVTLERGGETEYPVRKGRAVLRAS